MAEKKSLLLLRKEANELGIQNYAKYSRDELEKLIEQKKAGITTVTDEAMIASDEDVAIVRIATPGEPASSAAEIRAGEAKSTAVMCVAPADVSEN